MTDVDEFLAHYGVKGMKWGVRRDRRANNLVKVGAGRGSATDKLRAYAFTSPYDRVKGKGLRGGAARRGTRQLARNARVRAGESSAKDKLLFYGGSKHQDIFPTGKSSVNTTAAIGASIAGVILVNQGMTLVQKSLMQR